MELEGKLGSKKCMYRSEDDIRIAKDYKKDWVNTWFLKGSIRNTRSCQVTPGGVLKKELTKIINEGNNKHDTQITEDGGKPVHYGLMVKDPLRPSGCIFGDPKCPVLTNYLKKINVEKIC